MITRLTTLLAALLIATPAHAMQLDAEGCTSLAQFVVLTARIRDLGADVAKHLASAKKANEEQPIELQTLIETLIRGVYASKATPEQLGDATLEMCVRREGKIGEPA